MNDEALKATMPSESDITSPLGLIGTLAKASLEAQAQVERLESELKQAKAIQANIDENLLPDALAQANVTKFETENLTVSVKEDMQMSITVAHKVPAYNWLRQNELGALIKSTISVDFPQTTDQRELDEVSSLLQSRGLCPYTQDLANTSSVKAVLKKKMAEGVEIPLDLFGAYHFKRAVVKIKA